MINQVNRSFLIFTLGEFCILLLPEMFREGMFMDGLIYATLGHNMAHGIGTLWVPSFSEIVMYQFHEHPPLAFGIQGVLYGVFGSSFYIEKVYSALTGLATAAVVVKLWRLFAPAAIRELYWLPVFLWIGMPHCFWAYKNNMLENTMGLFSILALYVLVAMVEKGRKWPTLHILLAATLISCSFLTKGFPGLYPLGAFFLYFLVFQNRGYTFKKMAMQTAVLWIGFGAIIALILLYPPAAENLDRYFSSQVMGSLQGKRVVVSSRWHIMVEVIKELYFALGLTALVLGIAYRKGLLKLVSEKHNLRNVLFFLLVGLSASAPIMVSPKQLSFYAVPSLPYFAIAISALIAPVLVVWTARIRSKSIGFIVFRITGWALVGTALILAIAQSGSPVRDKDMLSDIDQMAGMVPHGTTIELTPNLSQDWSLMAYFQRKYFISLDPSGEERAYLLLQKGDAIPSLFEPVELDLNRYQLAKRITD